MKDIKVINKINREANSLTTLSIDGLEIPLTEKELTKLFAELYNMRKDAFTEYDEALENEELKERIKDLEEENEDLNSECDSLRDELDSMEDYDYYDSDN